jgi:hypothetical protein
MAVPDPIEFGVIRQLIFHERYYGAGLKTPEEQLKAVDLLKHAIEERLSSGCGYGVAFWMSFPQKGNSYQILLYIFDDLNARRVLTECFKGIPETQVINFTINVAARAPKPSPKECIDLEQPSFTPRKSNRVPLAVITGPRPEKRFFVFGVENKHVTTGNMICVNGIPEELKECEQLLTSLAGTLTVRREFNEWDLRPKPYDPKKHLCLENPTSEATVIHLLADVFAPAYHEELTNRGCSIEELCFVLGFDETRTSIVCEVYGRIYGGTSVNLYPLFFFHLSAQLPFLSSPLLLKSSNQKI